MSASVPVEFLRDVEGAIETATFALRLECARCLAEGPSPHCPNCGGVARHPGGNEA